MILTEYQQEQQVITVYQHIINTWSTDDPDWISAGTAGNHQIITVYQHIINTWSTDDND